MRLALAEAVRAGAEDEVPVGAAVVRDGAVLALDHNRVRATGDPTAHGEMLALAAAAKKIGDWRLCGCTLYTTKEPCPMCSGACVMARVDRVVFGVPDGRMGCLGGTYNFSQEFRFNHRFSVTAAVLSEECLGLLHDFFISKRKSRDSSNGET
jgi:tRNA(adenine34) deaminase